MGAAITLPISGLLIDYFNWESVFYVTGVLGLVWVAIWFLVMYDTPSQHPRITKTEREYLEKSIGIESINRKVSNKRKIYNYVFKLSTIISLRKLFVLQPHKVPWIKLFTSKPVWAIIITHAASVFCYFTFVNQLPTYMKHVLGLDIKKVIKIKLNYVASLKRFIFF